MTTCGIICPQSEPHIYVCGADQRPDPFEVSDITVSGASHGPPDVAYMCSVNSLGQLTAQKTITVMLVYVDDIALASMLQDPRWIQCMSKYRFVIISTGILQHPGNIVQFLGRMISRTNRGFTMHIKTDYLLTYSVDLVVTPSTRRITKWVL